MEGTAGRFPRGVINPARTHAYVHDGAGTVIAVDLATGGVLWRSGRALRPLLVVDDLVVAARIGGKGYLEVVTLDAEDGRTRRVSQPLVMPDWARPSLNDTPEYTLRSYPEGRSVVLSWAAHKRYQGGAPPGPQLRASLEREASGAARVDLDTGLVTGIVRPVSDEATPPIGPPSPANAPDHASDEAPDHAADQGPEPDQTEPTPPAAADVIEQQDIGTTRFELAARRGEARSAQILIRAVDRNSGSMVWETVIDDEAPTESRAPRPSHPAGPA